MSGARPPRSACRMVYARDGSIQWHGSPSNECWYLLVATGARMVWTPRVSLYRAGRWTNATKEEWNT